MSHCCLQILGLICIDLLFLLVPVVFLLSDCAGIFPIRWMDRRWFRYGSLLVNFMQIP